ncbi:MAG: alpha/beta fold hydrolase [Verrucomicrobiota bacterium]
MRASRSLLLLAAWIVAWIASSLASRSATPAAPTFRPVYHEGSFTLRDFAFNSGETLPEVNLAYRTLGEPKRDAKGVIRNAVLMIHGTTGDGTQFLGRDFVSDLYLDGLPLDVSKYYLIMPDCLGHGDSSKPSDGLRAKFPRYGYRDQITATYRLLTEHLEVKHLRLVIGASMGGMHVWLWGEMYPDYMDALVPLGSLPTQVSGRNRVWRRVIIDAIRNDPEWKNGNYETQPQSLRTAGQMAFFISDNPVHRQKAMPTLVKADEVLDTFIESYFERTDANDILYAVEASHDFDPGPELEKIRAPLLAINSADDLINPPELRIIEREIKRLPRGRFVMLPYTEETRGHGTHSIPRIWRHELVKLLAETEKK